MKDTIEGLIAKPHICCINENNNLQEAAKCLVLGDCSSLIVTDDDNKVMGIVTERDFTRKVVAEGYFEGKIGDICTKQLTTITAATSINDALALMHQHKVRHLPVIESGEIIGIVSMRDLFATIENRLQSEIIEISNFVFGDNYGARS